MANPNPNPNPRPNPNPNPNPNPSPNPSSTPNQVGGGVSYADVCIWSLLRDGSAEDLALVAEAAADCATLRCVADGVAALPTVAQWVQARPVTSF